ncbi:transcription factor ABORTED MICROSPORES isoform X2 [Amborella trichopoda]|uniref:BHLH domain-containing protein n=1 Tax=Amborella trichopoda TaxID=13333 RepID=W1NYG1_AMBTC|nr:transcription factor ABORTED MICROSPORES isoform X2 [Amborella trichopoda]ERN00424.1 hypothetical protein AMTR_s00100p00078730 [Amborella trichopoda]|eukprot:XP_006837855.1 transcription factor ABORTED MICROSPORES isoform X2 [Amborella trichopoda]
MNSGYFQERLRTLLATKRWNYCVYWKPSNDQRNIEWVGCCCGGATENGDSENGLVGSFASKFYCRDTVLPHPPTQSCHLLLASPTSIPLDSAAAGVYAQVLLSGQARWINTNTQPTHLTDCSEVGANTNNNNTRAFIPVPGGGLVELFAFDNVSEDREVIEFVMEEQWPANCPPEHPLHQESWQQQRQEAMMISSSSSSAIKEIPFHFSSENLVGNYQSFEPQSPTDLQEDYERRYYYHHHQMLDNRQKDFHHHPPWTGVPSPSDWGSYGQQQLRNNNVLFDGSADSLLSDDMMKPPISFPNLKSTSSSSQVKQEGEQEGEQRGDSISDCSEDDDEQKARSGRKHQSKNLVAERKRRKKLSERLYALRSLVPKITKMDRASILGDAIEYVKELQMLVKALQEELEETTEEERQQQQQQGNGGDGGAPPATTPSSDCNNHGGFSVMEERVEESSSSNHLLHIPNINNDCSDDKAQQQQMEVQVEVSQVGAHEFNLKIFCEKSSGGFARLMQAMDALGLEVIHVNITTYMSLVLNVFKVEMRDNEAIQAEHVRDSLLELTRNPNGWPSPVPKLQHVHLRELPPPIGAANFSSIHI